MKIHLALAVARLQAVRECLDLLAANGADAKTAGRRALLLAYLTAPDLIGTQRQLARQLGVSEARASQMLKVVRRNFGQ